MILSVAFYPKLKQSKNVENKNVDWILYIDSDAFFYRFDWNIDYILNKFNADLNKHILIENEPFGPRLYRKKICPQIAAKYNKNNAVNTGVILIRNSMISYQIINSWYIASKEKLRFDNNEPIIRKWPGDQAIFNCFISTNELYLKYITFDNTQYFVNEGGHLQNGFHDAFIQHYWSGNKKGRIAIKNFLSQKLKDETVRKLSKDRKTPYTIFTYRDVYI